MENSQDSSLCRLLLSANHNLAERPGLRLHAIALQGMFRQRVIVVYCCVIVVREMRRYNDMSKNLQPESTRNIQ